MGFVEERRGLNLEEEARWSVERKLWDISCMDEVLWRKKSRALWVNEGD